jgi:TatD DNase family protein
MNSELRTTNSALRTPNSELRTPNSSLRTPNTEHRTRLIDTHCHLDFPEFNQDRDEVIRRSKEQGIDYIINIGSSFQGSVKSLGLANQYDFIYATIGIHPHEADKFDKKEESALIEFLKQKKVVAVGEIGLDYYKNYSRPENQRVLFTSLLKLAKDFSLPLVIHSRNAHDDTLKALKEILPAKVVVHCFSGTEDFLKQCLELGFFVSFTCNITYKKADDLRRLVKITPLERLLLETDAPFLAPQGFRGKRNEPLYVKYLAKEIAGIKEVNLEEVARITTDNAKSFFKLGA